MQLIIDRGNTRTKVALFDYRRLVQHWTFDNDTDLAKFLQSGTPHDQHVFVSNVRETENVFLPTYLTRVSSFNAHTTLPFSILYKESASLGRDRLANVAGALALYSEMALLVIDSGSCVTYNVIHGRQFIGGAISPGLRMRLAAMHTFTGKLPLAELDTTVASVADSTTGCLQSGAFHGWCCEIDGMIGRICKEYGPMNVLVTGGDALLLERYLESPIFAHPLLTLIGLNEIYLYQNR
jgi:type III pantothenate kinase